MISCRVGDITWDILICSVPYRHDSLLALLKRLDVQMHPNVTVRLFRDNLEHTYGQKCQALLDAARGDYVSFIDDDDLVDKGFIHTVLEALELSRNSQGEVMADYVGFDVWYTIDGIRQLPVEHSLKHDGWNKIDDHPDVLTRDITQFNPIRTSIARRGHWEGGWQADFRWAAEVREAWPREQRCEVYIGEPLYYKQDVSGGDFRSRHSDDGDGTFLPLPSYSWLREISEVNQ